ncbi:hephaestin-like [Haliotis asinina]|uniref:hephaestin-like n=1 Tax=Haliotis asinina TaxID=109174 RepID=UPI003531D21E
MYTLLLVLTACVAGSLAIERHYYVAVVEVLWDFAPSGKDLVTPKSYNISSDADFYLERGPDRLGHVYKKAIYKEFTDATYTVEIPKPIWLGFVGPILKGEEGDFLIIHFKNFAKNYTYSMHAHGVKYNKTSEGALYADGYHNTNAAEDLVKPGHSHIYNWTITPEASPTPNSPDCLSWIYHSHVHPNEDINAGLVGFMYACKPGTLSRPNKQRHYAIYVSKVNEYRSWYIYENINMFAGNVSSIDLKDPRFQKSNAMNSFNGYIYGNLPGIEACQGETVVFHFAGLGHTTDLHTLAISGHTFGQFEHRQNSVRIEVAQFATVTMQARSVGRWLMYDQVTAHLYAGTSAFINIGTCNKLLFKPKQKASGRIRKYFIAAEEVLWNYAPSGKDLYDGGSLLKGFAQTYFKRNRKFIGGAYKKAVFVEFTDKSFKVQKPRMEDEEHLGLLGPPIRVEVGDVIHVYFLNRASRGYSIHPQGVHFDKANEGMLYNDNHPDKSKSFVKPGHMVKYYWTVPTDMGPNLHDPDCISRFYTSGVDFTRDSFSGLVGPLVLCRKGAIGDNDRQVGIDKEFFILYSMIDENYSWYLDENMKMAGVDTKRNKSDDEFIESNTMRSINGLMYGNLRGLNMCKGDRVKWHVFALGGWNDLHTLYLHGNEYANHHQHKVSTGLVSGALKTLTMLASNTGVWGIECHANLHFRGGLKAMYRVKECAPGPASTPVPHTGVERVYFIQAEVVEWDYTPYHRDEVSGQPFNTRGRQGQLYTNHTQTLLGTKYMKAVYKEYTDAKFRKPKLRTPDEEYLGILGPLIRLNVGDTLKIVFRNKAMRPYSVHTEGLHYSSARSAAWDPSERDQPIADPGKTVTYLWKVTPDVGPGEGDAPCMTRMYYSDVDVAADTNSGLVGPLVICKPEVLGTDGRRRDVDRDFAVFFAMFDENLSWYIDENINTFAGRPDLVNPTDITFVNSNHMHVINGYMFGNAKSPTMYEGERVDWYMMTLGSDFDLHSIHFHGNVMTEYSDTHRINDVSQLYPGMFITVRMAADNPGTWLYHCHVNNHIIAGMEGKYRVMPNTTRQGPNVKDVQELGTYGM